jgi:hypothetical protein
MLQRKVADGKKKVIKMRINVGAYTSNINSAQLMIGSQDFCSLEI